MHALFEYPDFLLNWKHEQKIHASVFSKNRPFSLFYFKGKVTCSSDSDQLEYLSRGKHSKT